LRQLGVRDKEKWNAKKNNIFLKKLYYLYRRSKTLSKKLSKSCQKLPKNCQKIAKKCQKSCQKVVKKVVKKMTKLKKYKKTNILKRVGGEGGGGGEGVCSS
jgi:hypothetical protein